MPDALPFTQATVGRRHWLTAAGAIGLASLLGPASASAPITRVMRSSSRVLPMIGLGSWITFNVGDDPVARARCTDVMRAFFEAGGGLIDSSPMYGSSQAVIGAALAELGPQPGLFAADKVWTGSRRGGPAQVETTRRLWGLPRLDLLQVHNLLAADAHLPMLFELKAAGRLGHVGLTTSHGRRHDELEALMKRHPVDFVQFTYNLVDREAEQRLLPLAQERDIAVIVNRPFQQGALLDALQRHPLPAWAAELQGEAWATLALKFIVSHPAVTCAIPATGRVDHLRQNMAAGHGALPDPAMRRRLADLARRLLG